MNLKLVSTTQDDSTGTYTDIEIRATENSKSKTIHLKSTAELNRLVDTYPNAKLSNFTVNPFTIRSNTVRSIRIIKDNNKQAVRNTTTATLSPDIYNKINMLNDNVNKLLNNQLIQIDGLRKLPTTINNTLPQVINNNLPQVTQDGIEQKLARIEDILNTLSDMLLDNEIKEDNLLDTLETNNRILLDKMDEIFNKLSITYDRVQEQFYKQKRDENSYKFPKCTSDINQWRYGGIDDRAFNFNYGTNNDGRFILDDERFTEDNIKEAFNAINNPESNISVNFDINAIIIARQFLQIYDECRQITETAYSTDLKSKVDDKSDALLNTSLNVVAGAASTAFYHQIKVLEMSASVTLGTTAAGITVAMGIAKAIYCVGKSILECTGSASVNLNNRGLHTKLTDLSTAVTKNTDGYKTYDVKHDEIRDNTDPENLKKLATFNCRIFTIDKLKAITEKPKLSRKDEVGNKNREYYKYVKHTLCRCPVTDERLFIFYIKYFAQPSIGFRYNGTKVSRISESDTNNRRELFNCFQNAYFTAYILLLTDSTLDNNLVEDRIKWLHSCSEVGSEGLNRVGHLTITDDYIIIFTKYLKLGLCIQGLSPICADKMIDMFCKYSNIRYRVLNSSFNTSEFRMDM